MQYQQEMQQAYLTLLQDLDQKMRALSETIAKENTYCLVLDQAAVVYKGAGATDMTDTLIKRYNAQ
jgi:Skp family chaperone for outer membrane proteins